MPILIRLRSSLAAAVALAGCAGALACAGATPREDPPPAPAAPRRAVLLSLDGTAAQELHRLQVAGRLAGGGFERFFERGEVAGGLVPVNPTLTAPSHASLVTGYPPASTGIVSNSFHIPGEPFLERANGFSVPIEAETLWEAAQRQGKRVGVVTWPSADDAGPRRRGDWGLTWTNSTLRPSQTVEVARREWRAMDAAHAADTPRSFSPPLTAAIALAATTSLPQQTLELVALDRADDGRTAYDAVLMRLSGWLAGEPLGAGEWRRLEQEVPPGETNGVSWAKLLALDPDLDETRLYLGAAYRAHAYPESFARRLDEAELWWPGPPDDRSLEDGMEGKPGIDLATWVEQAERFTVFFFDVMRLGARDEAWDLLLGYAPSNDEAGHELLLVDPRQRGYSPALAESFAAARERVFKSVDRELGRLIDELDLATTAVAVVSDHGMAPSHTSIDVASLLLRWGYLQTNDAGEAVPAGTRAMAVTSTALGHVYLHLQGREPQGERRSGRGRGPRGRPGAAVPRADDR